MQYTRVCRTAYSLAAEGVSLVYILDAVDGNMWCNAQPRIGFHTLCYSVTGCLGRSWQCSLVYGHCQTCLPACRRRTQSTQCIWTNIGPGLESRLRWETHCFSSLRGGQRTPRIAPIAFEDVVGMHNGKTKRDAACVVYGEARAHVFSDFAASTGACE